MDPATGEYNQPFLSPDLALVPGYRRLQGVVFRPDDPLFSGYDSALDAVAAAIANPDYLMINRNTGSGTRILVDQLLVKGAKPPGYWSQPKSHNAVAVAVAAPGRLGRRDRERRQAVRARISPRPGGALRLRHAAGPRRAGGRPELRRVARE
jgi:hypothetical protein